MSETSYPQWGRNVFEYPENYKSYVDDVVGRHFIDAPVPEEGKSIEVNREHARRRDAAMSEIRTHIASLKLSEHDSFWYEDYASSKAQKAVHDIFSKIIDEKLYGGRRKAD